MITTNYSRRIIETIDWDAAHKRTIWLPSTGTSLSDVELGARPVAGRGGLRGQTVAAEVTGVERAA